MQLYALNLQKAIIYSYAFTIRGCRTHGISYNCINFIMMILEEIVSSEYRWELMSLH